MRHDILTCSGIYFNFDQPGWAKIEIEDIAHALSNICRFTGHSSKFYSVAQHSVAVSLVIEPRYALYGLLHDAAEAFIGDVSSPLKSLLPDYKEIEFRVEKAILSRFGLAYPMPLEVKRADLIMLSTEQRDLLPPHDDEWEVIKNVKALSEKIIPLEPSEAKKLFLQRFYELTI